MVLALFLLGGQPFINTVQEVLIQHAHEQRETERLEQRARDPHKTLHVQGKQETKGHVSVNDVQLLPDEKGVLAEPRDQEDMPSTQKSTPAPESEFMALPAQTQVTLEQPQEDNRREEILETLKSVPAQAYKRRRDLYTELVAVSPNEEAALENLAFYTRQYAEQLDREQAEAQRKKKETENAIEEALALWAPLSVSLQDGEVTVVTKEPSVAEAIYYVMVQGICMSAPGSLHGVSAVSFVNRLSDQGLVFEGGETECKEHVLAKDGEMWVRGLTHRLVN